MGESPKGWMKAKVDGMPALHRNAYAQSVSTDNREISLTRVIQMMTHIVDTTWEGSSIYVEEAEPLFALACFFVTLSGFDRQS